jgi:hypothetical protein
MAHADSSGQSYNDGVAGTTNARITQGFGHNFRPDAGRISERDGDARFFAN